MIARGWDHAWSIILLAGGPLLFMAVALLCNALSAHPAR